MAVPRKHFNIIVVDDSEYARKSMANILDEAGFNVVGEAKSAEEAIKTSQSTPCHLFIVDVIMPEISGIDLIKYVKDNQLGAGVIMVSSLTLDHILIEAISNGALDYIQKPFLPEDLIAAADKVLRVMDEEKQL